MGVPYKIPPYRDMGLEKGIVSLYPGSTTVVSGVVIGKAHTRIDLHCKRFSNDLYYFSLLGSQDPDAKPLTDVGFGALSLCLDYTAAQLNIYQMSKINLRTAFLREFDNTLFRTQLCTRTTFAGFTSPGPVYVAFSQLEFQSQLP